MELDLGILQPQERAELQLRVLYEGAGFRKYHMGRFEEYSLYQDNRRFLGEEPVVTFTDLDGRLLALRPDVTISIAKNAQPGPGECLRYYYAEKVYRPSLESQGFREISQMGLEYIGAVSRADCAQAASLALQSLALTGADYVLELSHMGFVTGLLDAVGAPEAVRPRLLECLRQKNAHELQRAAAAAGLSRQGIDALRRLPALAGEWEQVLSAADTLALNASMGDALGELRGVCEALEAEGRTDRLKLDLSLVNDIDYYNGLVLQGYLAGFRGRCSRADGTTCWRKFTPGAEAIGFALYLDEMERLQAPRCRPWSAGADGRVMLNVALPKGRLGDKVYDLLAGVGYGCPEDYNADTRRLVVENPAAGHPLLPREAQRRGHLCGARRGGHRHRGQGHPHGVRRSDVYELLDTRPGPLPHVRGGPRRLPGRSLGRTLRVATKFVDIAKDYYAAHRPGHRHHQAQRLHRAGADPGACPT
jgi:ATP phosphoribosyltransferase